MDDKASPREVDLFRMTLTLAAAIMEIETALMEIATALPSGTDATRILKASRDVRTNVQEYMEQMRSFDLGS